VFLFIKYGVFEKDEPVKLLSSVLANHQDFSFGYTPFFEKNRRKNDRIRMKRAFLDVIYVPFNGEFCACVYD